MNERVEIIKQLILMLSKNMVYSDLSILEQLNEIEQKLIDFHVSEDGEYNIGRSEEEMEEQHAFCKEIYMFRNFKNFFTNLLNLIGENELDK